MYDILIAENIETYFETETPYSSNGLWFKQLTDKEVETLMKLSLDRNYSVTVFKNEDEYVETNYTN